MRTRFCLLACCTLIQAAGILIAAPAPADVAFETTARAFIEDYLRLNPEAATDLGDHRYDDKLTDYSPAALRAKIDLLRKYQLDLNRIDLGALTGANRIDA